MMCHEHPENNPVKFLNYPQMFIFLSSCDGKADMSPLNEELPEAMSQPWIKCQMLMCHDFSALADQFMLLIMLCVEKQHYSWGCLSCQISLLHH